MDSTTKREPAVAKGRNPDGFRSARRRANRPWELLATVAVLIIGMGCGSDYNSLEAVGTTDADDPARLGSVPLSAGPSSGDRVDTPSNGETPANEPGRASHWTSNAVVERVVDGDTIVAQIGGRSEPVRLIGIDTPESVARNRPVECYGLEASQRLQELLPSGTAITVVRDVEIRDIYDRLLGYVVRSSDGLFVNLELVASGHAATLNFPPNDHYADALSQAESQATAAGRGLWNACGGPDVPLE